LLTLEISHLTERFSSPNAALSTSSNMIEKCFCISQKLSSETESPSTVIVKLVFGSSFSATYLVSPDCSLIK
jgi:hypothetical protein